MLRGPYRLEHGGLLDRSKPIAFSFDGRALSGFEGDSLASALLANGVRTVARSFKFHRPRGVFSAGIEEPNALVQLHEDARSIPSARAPAVQLQRGLIARSQSGWPSVSFDLLRALDFAAPLFAAGFYNKTFLWPSWRVYEPAMRELAGLGRTPTGPDPDRYDVRNIHCEVLVVGGGAAGLAAAASAAATGERVVLIDHDTVLGGTSRWDGSSIEGVSAARWLESTIAGLQRAANVRCLPRTAAVGCYDHNVVTLIEDVEAAGDTSAPRERYWIVRPRRIVLATGAIEQPLVFCNNDRPGVMLAGAARR
ncbi:MAG: 2Fe-2S iron-sulfur cluster-binding protein, partial [Steroidobacteraceae bacterium]